ncbi:hypothetical protein FZJ44_08760, partial [Campylobacter jejuni]|nr:hypothetical protein [Campylobacter jejuni]
KKNLKAIVLKECQKPDFKSWIKIGKNHYRFALNAKEMVEFIYDSKEGLLKCIGSSRCKDLI